MEKSMLPFFFFGLLLVHGAVADNRMISLCVVCLGSVKDFTAFSYLLPTMPYRSRQRFSFTFEMTVR